MVMFLNSVQEPTPNPILTVHVQYDKIVLIERMITMYTVGIITASDSGFIGKREDLSGPLIEKIVSEKGYDVVEKTLLPDDLDLLFQKIIQMSDEKEINLILTTGGTGFSIRDNTPEATEKALTKRAPGICEAIRAYSLQITPKAMLSRGVSGIRNQTLIVNLPGSPKAVKESLEYALDAIHHGLEILNGDVDNCAR